MVVSVRRRLLAAVAIGIGVLFLMALGLVLLPLPHAIGSPKDLAPVSVLDRQGRILYESRNVDFGMQKSLTLSDVPQQAIDALIATEDRSFWNHHGISIRGIARAMKANVQARQIVAGGSTITQQLVRIRLQPKRRTVFYKFREMLLALKLDAVLSKEQILEQYLQSVYFGHQAYGLRSATRTYFGKEPGELSLSETALLIGMVQSPVALDAFENPDGALQRRNIVLSAMRSVDAITLEQETEAKEERVFLAPDSIEIRAPHFVFWVLDRYSDRALSGANIVTTLDGDLQAEIEDIVRRKVDELRDRNVSSAAVVVIDAHTGEVLSMVGSASYFDEAHDGAVNVATSARQPGSSLKPFTYALALEQGDTAATTVADTDIHLLTEEGNPYTPRNYDYDLHGLVRYREALANSYNIAAVKVLEHVGVSRLLSLLRAAGITTLDREPEFYGLALTLGSGEVKLLELAQAYGIFARQGNTLTIRALPDEALAESEQVIDPRTAWIITDILSDPTARLPEFGETTPLSVPPHRVAAKTGTTRNARDNWVIGYTPDRIVGVWVGNADNTPMRGTSGVTGAGPIFHDVMEVALRSIPPTDFPRPPRIVEQSICSTSGKMPTPACPHTMLEYFAAGTEPIEPDDIHRLIRIDRRNRLLAGESCPDDVVIEESFTIFPPEVRAWARENGFKEPPTNYSPLCDSGGRGGSFEMTGELVITNPQPADSFLLDPLIPDVNERIILEARAPRNIQEIEWRINDIVVGTGISPDYRVYWNPIPGTHRIEAISGENKDSVIITVIEDLQ